MSAKAQQDFQVDDVIEDQSVQRPGDSSYVKKYKKGRYLGKGGFAKVFELTSCDSNRTYAGKVIPKTSLAKTTARRKLLNEIKIHHSINHEHIVKFERFFEDKTNVYILLEICPNNTLMELVKRRKRLTEAETQVYMWQLIKAVTYMHSQNIIHRDLKLGNLFLDANLEIKVGDFGLATRLAHPSERKRTICGTPNYIAPEVLNSSTGHSFEVDVWSMGVIMYTMLIGKPPFETTSVKSTYKKIRANSYEFPDNISISPAAKQLIQQILHAKPEMRPTPIEMKHHPFFYQSPFPSKLPQSILVSPLEYPHLCHPESQLLSSEALSQVKTLGVVRATPASPVVSSRSSEEPVAGSASRASLPAPARVILSERRADIGNLPQISVEHAKLKSKLAISQPASSESIPPEKAIDLDSPRGSHDGVSRDALAGLARASVSDGYPRKFSDGGWDIQQPSRGRLQDGIRVDAAENINPQGHAPSKVRSSSLVGAAGASQPTRPLEIRSRTLPKPKLKSHEEEPEGKGSRMHVDIPREPVLRVHSQKSSPPVSAPAFESLKVFTMESGARGRDSEDDFDSGGRQLHPSGPLSARGPGSSRLFIRTGLPRSHSEVGRKHQISEVGEMDIEGDMEVDSRPMSLPPSSGSSPQFGPVHSRGRTSMPKLSLRQESAPGLAEIGEASGGDKPHLSRARSGSVGNLGLGEMEVDGKRDIAGARGAARSSARLRSDSADEGATGSRPASRNSRPGTPIDGQVDSQPDSAPSSRASSRAASPGPNTTIHPDSRSSSRSSSRGPSPAPGGPGFDSRPTSPTAQPLMRARSVSISLPVSRPSSPPASAPLTVLSYGDSKHERDVREGDSKEVKRMESDESPIAAPDEDFELHPEDIERLQELARIRSKRSQDDAEDAILRQLFEEMTKTSSALTPHSAQMRSLADLGDLFQTEVCVTKWVDYSKKYGLGYLLSNGMAGVHYNDSSKAVLLENGKHVQYLEKASLSSGVPVWRQYTTDYSEEGPMKKKIVLLTHFVEYLNAQHKEGPKIEYTAKRLRSSLQAPTYVSKWVRTRYAIVFQLSSRVVQVAFLDQSQLIFAPDLEGRGVKRQRKISFITKEGIRTTIPLDRAFANPVLFKKIQYVQQVFSVLLGAAAPHSDAHSARSYAGAYPLGPPASAPSAAVHVPIAHSSAGVPAAAAHSYSGHRLSASAAIPPSISSVPAGVSNPRGITNYLTNLRLLG